MPLYPLIRTWYISHTSLHTQRKISYEQHVHLLGTLLLQMSAKGLSLKTFEIYYVIHLELHTAFSCFQMGSKLTQYGVRHQ